MKTFYHITLKRNFKSIMKNGLIPKIGSRSKALKEEMGVFLFPTVEDMETALSNWFGDCFSERTPLISLEINLPDDFPIIKSIVNYEQMSKIIISPQYIKYFRNE